MSNFTRLKRSELPRNTEKIAFNENGDTFHIIMGRDGITENMQENSAAFEAWSLVAKAAGYKQVILSETIPTGDLERIKKLHYNRFLYRASCFNRGFDWFSISDELKKKIEDFEKSELTRDLFINAPLSEPKIPNEKSHEAVVESRFTHDTHREYLNGLLGTKIDKFHRQLPVGLFGERVVSANAIFPRNNAAIDIWGVKGSTFHLIELKVKQKIKHNKDLGVLSEVFFYACFIYDMCCIRRLERKDPADLHKHKKDGNYFRGFPQLVSASIDSVVAYILTENKHPKLDGALAELQKHKLEGIKFAKAICYPLSDTVVKP